MTPCVTFSTVAIAFPDSEIRKPTVRTGVLASSNMLDFRALYGCGIGLRGARPLSKMTSGAGDRVKGVMEIGEALYGDVVVLSPSGRLDQENAPVFQDALLKIVGARGAAVVIDFSAIPYISSIGLRALMIAAKQGKVANVTLAVAGLSPEVNEVFEISRFSFVVKVFGSIAEALDALSDEAAAAYRDR